MPRTLLVVGHGPGPGRAVARARALGLTVAVVPARGAGRPGADVVEPLDEHSVVRAVAEHKASGALASAPDAVVPVARAAAAAGLPGAGAQTAERLASRIALRRGFAEAGVPQPRFAAVRTVHERRAALSAVGLPARLLPAEPWIDEGRFGVVSPDDLDAHLHRTLAASPGGEAVLEGAPVGTLVDVVVACRGGRTCSVTTLDRPGDGLLLYPSTLFGDALEAVERTAVHAVHALGVVDGIAILVVALANARAEVAEARSWTPADSVDALLRHAVGVDLLELAIRLALGLRIRPWPRFRRPAALRLTRDGAPPDDPPWIAERGDGYVVATAETNIAALERTGAPA